MAILEYSKAMERELEISEQKNMKESVNSDKLENENYLTRMRLYLIHIDLHQQEKRKSSQ